MKKAYLALALFAACALPASAALTSTTQHGVNGGDLNGQIAVGDLISGILGTELPGDNGWHPANPNPADQLPILTDDAGGAGVQGLLNDFPTLGQPTKLLQYDLAAPADIAMVQILSGNDGGDGRIFSTTVVKYSTDGGANFTDLGYFQSDPSGTLNNAGTTPQYRSTLVQIFDDAGGAIMSGVTNIQFDLYAVDNTGGQMRDPFDGINPFTGADDGLTAAFVAPLIWELDVIEVPEPASLALLALGGLAVLRRR
jgi:hypothetical protein